MNSTATLTDHTVAVYATHDQAEQAIKDLTESGYDLKNLSIIGQNYQSEEQPVAFVNTGDRMLTWGKYGAFWGSIWAVMFGSAMLFVPAIGPVLLAGWIVTALEGALVGGGIAALAGALTSIGIPENSVVEYEMAVKAGSFVVMVHGSEQETQRAKSLLASGPASRVDSYTSPSD